MVTYTQQVNQTTCYYYYNLNSIRKGLSIMTTNTTKKNINDIIKEIKEYQTLQTQLKDELEILKSEAIEYLNENNIDEYLTDDGKITYREVISNRFDSTAFKKDFADIYKEYTKPTSNMRFTCN